MSVGKFFWVTCAMAGARTAAMTLNRIIDLSVDRLNPRTAGRPLGTGRFPLGGAWAAAAVSSAALLLSAWSLNRLCFMLAFPALVMLTGYSYVKRFSWACHFALGAVLAAAPVGGWLAVTGQFSWLSVPLALGVLFWVAGFDILYSLQDLEFDRAHGLHSVPVRFGQERALRLSRLCHAATLALLVLFGVTSGLGVIYWTGLALCAALLYIEHSLISGGDLSRLHTAFFTINGWVGILLLVFTFIETIR
jgi:4-hydroxybenzoate polyprenyltransferase